MNLLVRSLPRARSWLALVLVFCCVMLPQRAWAVGAEGGASVPDPDPSARATPSPHRLQLTAGIHGMFTERMDYGGKTELTPSVQAAYLYRASRNLEVGAGLGGYWWTNSQGGPIFFPYATGRAFLPFSSSAEAGELGFSIRMGATIGYYHAKSRNHPDGSDHKPIHTEFGLALGPDVRVPLHRGTSLHLSLEAAGFRAEDSSIDYYVPIGSIGVAVGIVTAL